MGEYIVRETGYPGTLKKEVVGEIVRCKDCINRHEEDKCPMCYWTYDDDEEYFLDKSEDNGFCDRGERRADGTVH